MANVKSPYRDTPYDVLSDPQLGPLPMNVSSKQVQERYTRLARSGGKAVSGAFFELRSPGKRIEYDVFCVPLEPEGLRELGALTKEKLNFAGFAPSLPELAGYEFLVLDELSLIPTFNAQEITFTLSTLYDEPENLVSQVHFDL